MAMDGYNFTPATVTHLTTRIRAIPRPSLQRPAAVHVARFRYFSKITGFSGGVYQWTMQQEDQAHPGQFIDLNDMTGTAITGTNAHEINGNTTVPSGTIVEMEKLMEDGSGVAHYWFTVRPPLLTPTNPLDLTFSGPHAEAAGQSYDAAFDLTALPSHSPPYDGVKVTRSQGPAYYSAGDAVLYVYLRDELYDLQGRLVSATATRRVMVDSPVNCS
ncbi:MAG: hypothetical protein WCI73_00810 [Phycisphaerae bacterium]